MPDVARAVVLPDIAPPSIHDVFTLLLFWDSVEIVFLSTHAAERYVQDDSRRDFDALIEHGAASWSVAPFQNTTRNLGGALDIDVLRANVETRGGLAKVATDAGNKIVDDLVRNVRAVLARTDARGLASITTFPFSTAAAQLPAQTPYAARAESALLQAATTAISVEPATVAEDILRFREKNAALMGRFRAAIGDLAETMHRDAPPAAIMEHAHALVANRVEPTLADLAAVLKRRGVRYTWTMLLGASSVVLAPVSPATVATGGSRLVAQTLDYAFDRTKLVRHHPYGLLHQAQTELTTHTKRRPAPPNPIVDPLEMLQTAFAAATERMFECIFAMTDDEAPDATEGG